RASVHEGCRGRLGYGDREIPDTGPIQDAGPGPGRTSRTGRARGSPGLHADVDVGAVGDSVPDAVRGIRGPGRFRACVTGPDRAELPRIAVTGGCGKRPDAGPVLDNSSGPGWARSRCPGGSANVDVGPVDHRCADRVRGPGHPGWLNERLIDTATVLDEGPDRISRRCLPGAASDLDPGRDDPAGADVFVSENDPAGS